MSADVRAFVAERLGAATLWKLIQTGPGLWAILVPNKAFAWHDPKDCGEWVIDGEYDDLALAARVATLPMAAVFLA